MFTDNRISEFKNKIQSLADRPQMSAQALKEYFDSSAEELRIAHNALIDALSNLLPHTFSDVHYNAADGKLTFTVTDGTEKCIDLPLELLVTSGRYDADAQNIVLLLANGDELTIPAGNLVDTYFADGNTLICKENTFAVKDGVFAKEAAADGKLYGRKNGTWEEVVSALPTITLAAANDICEGVYKVTFGGKSGVLCASIDLYLYDKDYVDITNSQAILYSDGTLLKRARTDFVMSVTDDLVQTADGGYRLKDGYVFGASWEPWESAIPSLAGYAATSYVNAQVKASAEKERKLKLLKTITLAEDVAQINVEFDKPLDEFAILYDVAFTKAETAGRLATRTDGGNWYVFFRSNLSLSTNKRYWYAHAKEVAERQWEHYVSDWFSQTGGSGDSTTSPKIVVSKRIDSISRFIEKLNIFMPNNSTENMFAAGSTIEIWGHEADE